jgi:hypothetical protein
MTARLRLSRAKGFRLPDDAVSVARPTKWGNPFVVGRDGSAADCVRLYGMLLGGLLCMSCAAPVAAQKATIETIERDWIELVGKRLACWCQIGRPCHADVLGEIVAKMAEIDAGSPAP